MDLRQRVDGNWWLHSLPAQFLGRESSSLSETGGKIWKFKPLIFLLRKVFYTLVWCWKFLLFNCMLRRQTSNSAQPQHKLSSTSFLLQNKLMMPPNLALWCVRALELLLIYSKINKQLNVWEFSFPILDRVELEWKRDFKETVYNETESIVMKRSCGLEIITLNRRLKIIIVILLYSCTQSFNFKYNFYLICHPYQYAFSVFAKSSLSADFSIVETGSYYHYYCYYCY